MLHYDYTKTTKNKLLDGQGLQVIPKIDVPGHFQSALAAYLKLGCFGRKVKVARKKAFPRLLSIAERL